MSSRSGNFLHYLLAQIPAYRRWSVTRYYGPKFNAYCKTLQRQEHFTPEQQHAYQEQHFLKIIHHAFDNVPFYKQLYTEAGLRKQDIRSLDDIAKLPCIDKEKVRLHFAELTATNSQQFRPYLQSTSGSTAKPLEILIDADNGQWGEAMLWRHYRWAGYEFHHKAAYICEPFGFRQGHVDTTQLSRFDVARKVLSINTAFFSEDRMAEICAELAAFQPEVILSYPHLLELLGKYLKQHPAYRLSPKAVVSRAEKFHPHMRRAAEAGFHCDAFEIYAQWEYICFAADCPQHQLHHFFDLGIVEILTDGAPCPAGAEGEIVATSLHNYSMPLIRYKLNDLGRLTPSHCACGLKMPILQVLGSRNKDMVVSPRGQFYVTANISAMLEGSKYIKQFQIFQEDIHHVELRIVKLGDFPPDALEATRRTISDYFLDSLEVTIRFVDEIPRTAAGKYQYVESKVPMNA